MSDDNLHLEEGKRVLRIEAQAILNQIESLNGNFSKCVEMICQCKGKVIVTGMGKSGKIGQKISSTFSSTGTPSVFLHPAEASHGDLGVISDNDLVLAISYGGESDELTPILRFLSRRNIPLIAMTKTADSSLAKQSLVHLVISVSEEACPLSLAPTASSTVTLAIGDALAMAAMKARGFSPEDFAEVHPSGSLGRRLLTRVEDLMHSGEALPLVSVNDPMSKVVAAMTAKEVRGVAGVIDDSGELAGIITDGDIRRRLERKNEAFTEKASELMSRNPKTIDKNELAQKALFVMEQFRIQILFVMDRASKPPRKPVGLLHLQDLIKARLN